MKTVKGIYITEEQINIMESQLNGEEIVILLNHFKDFMYSDIENPVIENFKINTLFNLYRPMYAKQKHISRRRSEWGKSGNGRPKKQK